MVLDPIVPARKHLAAGNGLPVLPRASAWCHPSPGIPRRPLSTRWPEIITRPHKPPQLGGPTSLFPALTHGALLLWGRPCAFPGLPPRPPPWPTLTSSSLHIPRAVSRLSLIFLGTRQESSTTGPGHLSWLSPSLPSLATAAGCLSITRPLHYVMRHAFPAVGPVPLRSQLGLATRCPSRPLRRTAGGGDAPRVWGLARPAAGAFGPTLRAWLPTSSGGRGGAAAACCMAGSCRRREASAGDRLPRG